MERNLMLTLAMPAISVPGFTFVTEAAPRDSSQPESSMHNADKHQKKKEQKENRQRREQESGTDFSIYR